MRNYETIEVTSGAFEKADSVGKFDIYVDKSYIYFNRKHYTVIAITKTDNSTIYKTECLRHSGKRYIKRETMFVDFGKWVSYVEIISIESI